jgi:hypothetical protein
MFMETTPTTKKQPHKREVSIPRTRSSAAFEARQECLFPRTPNKEPTTKNKELTTKHQQPPFSFGLSLTMVAAGTLAAYMRWHGWNHLQAQ